MVVPDILIDDFKYVYIAYDKEALDILMSQAKRKKKQRDGFDYVSVTKALSIFTTDTLKYVVDAKRFTFKLIGDDGE